MLAAVCVGLTVPTGAAVAAGHPPRPGPTVRVVTEAAGRPLPSALINGGWDGDSRTFNQLRLGGTTATGTTTMIDAAWTSAWEWTLPRRPALFVDFDVQHESVLPGADPSTWGYTVEMRTAGGRWQPDPVTSTQRQAYDPQFGEEWDLPEIDTLDQRVHVQWRVHFQASVSATYREQIKGTVFLITRGAGG